jgi:hypothetical protein
MLAVTQFFNYFYSNEIDKQENLQNDIDFSTGMCDVSAFDVCHSRQKPATNDVMTYVVVVHSKKSDLILFYECV